MLPAALPGSVTTSTVDHCLLHPEAAALPADLSPNCAPGGWPPQCPRWAPRGDLSQPEAAGRSVCLCKYRGFSVATNSAAPCQAPGSERTPMRPSRPRQRPARVLGVSAQTQSPVGRKPALSSAGSVLRGEERIPQRALVYHFSRVHTSKTKHPLFVSISVHTVKVTAAGRTGAEAETSNRHSSLPVLTRKRKARMIQKNTAITWGGVPTKPS